MNSFTAIDRTCAARCDRITSNAKFGPLATKCRGIVRFPNVPECSAILKHWFVECDFQSILEEWCNEFTPSIFASDKEMFGHAYDAYDVARCWLWMIHDEDVNERPELMPKLSAEFKTSCWNLWNFVPAFLLHDPTNEASQMALTMMIRRAKDELKASQGWE